MRTLYLESVSGIAGDMFAAAFLDAGLVEEEALLAVPGQLGFAEARVVVTRVRRSEIDSVHLDVVVGAGTHEPHGHPHEHGHAHGHGHGHTHDPRHGHGHGHAHAHYRELDARLEASELAPPAKAFARKVFRLLAESEARAHGCAPEDVAFHEVGDVDSIVDVAMAGVCVAAVAPDRVLASPVKLGRGTVSTRHGRYPVPPPASAHLAAGMPVAGVPEEIVRTDVELSTPTGLAILGALAPEFHTGWPVGVPVAHGFGAGTTDLGGYPNVFRVVLLEAEHGLVSEDLPYESDTVVEIECNVDDQTGERCAWMVRRALRMGALDAWLTPVLGKKGRPALCFTLLVPPSEAPRFADWLLRHTSTFGVRHSSRRRLKLAREEEVRTTPRGPVRFKVGRTTAGEKLKEKAEFDDLEKIWEDDPDFLP